MLLSYEETIKRIKKVEKISDKRLLQLMNWKLKPQFEVKYPNEQLFDEEEVKKLCHSLSIVKRDYQNISELSKTKGYARATIYDLIEEHKEEIKVALPPLVPYKSYRSKDINRLLKSRKVRKPLRIIQPGRYRNMAPFILNGQEGRIAIRLDDRFNVWIVVLPNGKRITLKRALKEGGFLKYKPLSSYGIYQKNGNEVTAKISLKDTFGRKKELVDFLFEYVPGNLFSFDYKDDDEVILHIVSGRFSLNRSSVKFSQVNQQVKQLNNLFKNKEFEATTNLLDSDNIEVSLKSLEKILKVPVDEKTYKAIVAESKVYRLLDQNYLRSFLQQKFS